MKNRDIIDILEKQAGLNSETLIFDPEKAENFINSADKNRIAFLPVRPDWNEAKKVFGYYNPLTGLFYPTDGLKVLLNAFRSLLLEGKDKQHFIILDEMNLARVEYYFSDILSLMENMWKVSGKEIIKGETSLIHPIERCVFSKIPNIDAYKKSKDKEIYNKYITIDESKGYTIWQDIPEKKCQEDCSKCLYGRLVMQEIDKLEEKEKMVKFIDDFSPIPPRIAYPENLVIIGTVNVDETTFSFAPKVLDRAFQLEFTDVHWDKYLNGKRLLKKEITEDSNFYKFVKTLQEILKVKNMHFGYRVIKEMLDYLNNAGKEDDVEYDFLLKSKVLPKFHGTEEQIGDVLVDLLKFCANDEHKGKISAENLTKEKLEEEQLRDKLKYKYPDSAIKLLQMYQNMKATGYCSYF